MKSAECSHFVADGAYNNDSLCVAGGVTAMACDSSGLLASGSHSGVINLLQTGRHAVGTTLRLLPPHPSLSLPTETPLAHSAETPTAQDEENR